MVLMTFGCWSVVKQQLRDIHHAVLNYRKTKHFTKPRHNQDIAAQMNTGKSGRQAPRDRDQDMRTIGPSEWHLPEASAWRVSDRQWRDQASSVANRKQRMSPQRQNHMSHEKIHHIWRTTPVPNAHAGDRTHTVEEGINTHLKVSLNKYKITKCKNGKRHKWKRVRTTQSPFCWLTTQQSAVIVITSGSERWMGRLNGFEVSY